jgi:hypothetical protein
MKSLKNLIISIVVILPAASMAVETVNYNINVKSRYVGGEKPSYSDYECRLQGQLSHPWLYLNHELHPLVSTKALPLEAKAKSKVWADREVIGSLTQNLNRINPSYGYGMKAGDDFTFEVVERCEYDYSTTITTTYTCGNSICLGSQTYYYTDYVVANYKCPLDKEVLSPGTTAETKCVFDKFVRNESSKVAAALQAREITLKVTPSAQETTASFSNCTGRESEKFLFTFEGGLRTPRDGEYVLNVIANGNSFQIKSSDGIFNHDAILCLKSPYTDFEFAIEGRDVGTLYDAVFMPAGPLIVSPITSRSIELELRKKFWGVFKTKSAKLLISIRRL